MFPIANDAVIFGILMVILAIIFHTAQSSNPFCIKFYKYIPALLLCYFIPSVLTSTKIIDIHNSQLYFVASRYLLPASLVLLTLSIDLKSVRKLGPKALVMFFAATFSVVIGGPIAIWTMGWVSPQTLDSLYIFNLDKSYHAELESDQVSSKLQEAFAKQQRDLSGFTKIEKENKDNKVSWKITSHKYTIQTNDSSTDLYGWQKNNEGQMEKLFLFSFSLPIAMSINSWDTIKAELQNKEILLHEYDKLQLTKENNLEIIEGPYLIKEQYGELLVSRDIAPRDIARGMATLAGSWIGGGANQAAMKEVFGVDNEIFSAMITVDVLVANFWMAFLLLGAANYRNIDKKMKADNSAIESLRKKMEDFQSQNARIPSLSDLFLIIGVGFGITAFSHFGAELIVPYISENAPTLSKFSLTSSFFWLIVLATTGGLVASFTKARYLEGAGASRIGSVLLYILVATIGMKMDLLAIFRNPDLFLLGFIWIFVHIFILLSVGYFIRSPFFFVAVGSQANIGGAASAPIVASAVNPSLAPVGVLLAVLGYALGTYFAWICGHLMIWIAG